MRRLAEAGQSLERLETSAAVADALPAMALGLVRADGVTLVRVDGSAVVRIASRGVRLDVATSASWLEMALAASWSGQPRLLATGVPRVAPASRLGPPSAQRPARDIPGRALFVPIGSAGDPWVLVVGRVGPGEAFSPSDLGPLSVLRALAEASLARIRAHGALGEIVSREVAILEVANEALLVVDRAGIVRAMSVAAAERLGVPRERALGRRLGEVAVLAPLTAVLASEDSRSGTPVVLGGVRVRVRAALHEAGLVLALGAIGEPSERGAPEGAPRDEPQGVPGAEGDERVPTWDEMERLAIQRALRHYRGSVARAAKALGVAKGTVYNKMRRYGIELRAGDGAPIDVAPIDVGPIDVGPNGPTAPDC
jgi:PAS domain-containing protein